MSPYVCVECKVYTHTRLNRKGKSLRHNLAVQACVQASKCSPWATRHTQVQFLYCLFFSLSVSFDTVIINTPPLMCGRIRGGAPVLIDGTYHFVTWFFHTGGLCFDFISGFSTFFYHFIISFYHLLYFQWFQWLRDGVTTRKHGRLSVSWKASGYGQLQEGGPFNEVEVATKHLEHSHTHKHTHKGLHNSSWYLTLFWNYFIVYSLTNTKSCLTSSYHWPNSNLDFEKNWSLVHMRTAGPEKCLWLDHKWFPIGDKSANTQASLFVSKKREGTEVLHMKMMSTQTHWCECASMYITEGTQ